MVFFNSLTVFAIALLLTCIWICFELFRSLPLIGLFFTSFLVVSFITIIPFSLVCLLYGLQQKTFSDRYKQIEQYLKTIKIEIRTQSCFANEFWFWLKFIIFIGISTLAGLWLECLFGAWVAWILMVSFFISLAIITIKSISIRGIPFLLLAACILFSPLMLGGHRGSAMIGALGLGTIIFYLVEGKYKKEKASRKKKPEFIPERTVQ